MCSVGRYHDTVQLYRAGVDELIWASGLLLAPTPSRVALLCELADLHLRMADSDTAHRVLAEAEELELQVGPPDWNDVAVARSLGELANRAGRYGEVVDMAQRTLQRELSPRGAARMWSLLGIAQCSTGDIDAGLSSLERCLGLYRELKDAPAIAIAHGNVAEAAWRSGNTAKAAVHQRACLENGLAIGQQVAIAHSLIMAAHLARLREAWSVALPLYRFAITVLTQAGHELYADERAIVDQTFDRARQLLGQEAIDRFVEEADAMTVIDATAVAQTIFDKETAAAATQPAIIKTPRN